MTSRFFHRIVAVAFVAVTSSAAADAQGGTTVVLPSSTSGISLGGTLAGINRPRAAAVLVSVAGPDDRDMRIGPHRIFGDLADSLAGHRIASLRYDDRGVGASGGDWRATSFDDRANDVCAAVGALREHARDVPLGIIGMSEGGGLALRAAQRCAPIAFVILLSTPLRSGQEELRDQVDRLTASAKVADSVRAALKASANRLIDVIVAPSGAHTRDSLTALLRSRYGASLLPPFRFVPADVDGRVDFLLSPWYRSQVLYDVSVDLARYQGPVLGIYGLLDMNIEPRASADRLRRERPDAQVQLLPSLNHLLQRAKTGSPLEYAQLPAGIDPSVSTLLVTWILAR